MYIYVYIYTGACVYIYIYRYIHLSLSLYLYAYIHIYINQRSSHSQPRARRSHIPAPPQRAANPASRSDAGLGAGSLFFIIDVAKSVDFKCDRLSRESKRRARVNPAVSG